MLERIKMGGKKRNFSTHKSWNLIHGGGPLGFFNSHKIQDIAAPSRGHENYGQFTAIGGNENFSVSVMQLHTKVPFI